MTEEEKRELQERAHLVEELTKHPGWEVLTDLVLFGPGGSATHQRQLVKGVKDWDDYQVAVGIIRGIHHVTEAPDRLRRMVAEATAAEEA